jgi:hypothetical protein
MGWKRTVLADYDEKGIDDNATSEVIKLPNSIISAIHLRLSGTGGSGTPAVDNLIATTKIKTDKGYIFDMRSEDMHVLAKKITGRKPIITNSSGAYSETNHSIYFGRFPKDKALMLDLRNSNVRLIELTFGTLVATSAFATGTVKLTVTIDEWVGALPPEYVGFLSAKEVENKATGTGKAVFELFSGNRCAALLINVGTITTVRQCTLSDKSEKVIFGKANFRDLLNIHNIEDLNITAVETLYAYWAFYDKDPKSIGTLPYLSMSDPILSIERGSTTTTSRVVQIDLRTP